MVRVKWMIMGGDSGEVDTPSRTVGDLMKELGISSEEYVPSINGKVVTPDRELKDGDRIVFVPVVSGG